MPGSAGASECEIFQAQRGAKIGAASSRRMPRSDFTQQIWIAQTATGERYQLTSGKKSSSAPQWSPDSRRLAFVSDRDGKRQLYLIAPGGGEAIQLTTEENGVTSASW